MIDNRFPDQYPNSVEDLEYWFHLCPTILQNTVFNIYWVTYIMLLKQNQSANHICKYVG